MEQCALELGTLWGAATIDENFASINPSRPITCLSRWSKNPFGEAKWAFYVPPQRLKEVDTRARTQEREPPKWEVSVPLRGLTLTVDSDTVGLSYFYQDHLRIDQVPTSLWHRHENKINLHLLIYLDSDICYITGCFLRLMSCEAERHRCSRSLDVQAKAAWTARFRHASLPAQICSFSSHPVMVFPLHSFPVFFLPELWWELPLNQHWFGKFGPVWPVCTAPRSSCR